MQIMGSLDRCNEVAIEGWVTVAGQPDIKPGLEFRLGGKVVGRCVANSFRKDLKDAGGGNSEWAISFETPVFVPKSESKRIAIFIESSNAAIQRWNITADETGASIGLERAGRCEGLWMDRYDWMDRWGGKYGNGEIFDEISTAISRFFQGCYLAWDVQQTSVMANAYGKDQRSALRPRRPKFR